MYSLSTFTIGADDFPVREACEIEQECFCDTDEYLQKFLKAANGEKYLAVLEDGKAVGGMFLFEVRIFSCGREYSGNYVFALGVKNKYRGKGYSRLLLCEAQRQGSDFSLICPADRGLSAYYKRMGFDRFISGIVPKGAEQGFSVDTPDFDCNGDYADMVCSAKRYGGLLLSRAATEFAIADINARLMFCRDKWIVRADNGVYAACGADIARGVHEKAQLHLKKEIVTDSIFADLIMEV